jgi:hypothetical protein
MNQTTDRRQRRIEEAARRRIERRQRAERAVRRARTRRVMLRWTGRTLAGVAAVAVGVTIIGLAVHVIRNATKPGPGHLPPMTPIHAYRVDYRTTFTKATVNDEQRVVERPFHSLDMTRRGGQVITGTLNNDQGLWFYDPAKGWSLINPNRQQPENDPRPAAGLIRALKTGKAKVTGKKTVAGRKCTLVRTGSPIGEPLKKATGSNHADLCLDRTGVILDYRWVLNGKEAQTMTALSFDDHPVIGPDTFATTPGPVSTNAPVQSAPLTDDGRGKLSPKISAPAGFADLGGTVSIRGVGASLQPSTDLLFQHGDDDLLTVSYTQGASSHAGLPAVVLNRHFTGYLKIGLDLNNLIVPNGPDSTVTISGPDPDLLIALARTLG